MKSLFFLLMVLIVPIIGYSQTLLGVSEDQVKTQMKNDDVYFKGKNYTDTGSPYLEFQYTIDQLKSNGGASSVYAYFDNNKCNQIMYVFTSDDHLADIISQFQKGNKYEKIDDFNYIDNNQKVKVKFKRVENTNGFLLMYKSF